MTTPIELLVDEMNGCVDAGLYFGAISLAVALPSVCASLEMEDGRAQGPEYLKWCRENLYPNKGFDLITPEELLSLRNGFTHQGRSELKNNKKGRLEPVSDNVRVTFLLPNNVISIDNSTVTFDGGEKTYAYNLDEFCARLSEAVLEWLEKTKDHKLVQQKMEEIATYRSLMGVKAIY